MQTCAQNTFADKLSNTCVQTCPIFGNTFGLTSDWTCNLVCPSGLFSDNSTRMCVSSKLCSVNTFSDPVKNTC